MHPQWQWLGRVPARPMGILRHYIPQATGFGGAWNSSPCNMSAETVHDVGSEQPHKTAEEIESPPLHSHSRSRSQSNCRPCTCSKPVLCNDEKDARVVPRNFSCLFTMGRRYAAKLISGAPQAVQCCHPNCSHGGGEAAEITAAGRLDNAAPKDCGLHFVHGTSPPGRSKMYMIRKIPQSSVGTKPG